MMKKELRYITMGMALVATILAGCSRFEEEDLFEESAALRIEHNADKLQKILVDAPYGWVMQYYTGKGVSIFEGFNLFAKFEEGGKVTMAGNHRFLRDGNAGKYTEYASLYELIREDGLVLAFNTWNDILTPFVDPVAFWAAPKYIIKDGEGMQGDQNLVIKSMRADEVICRGERYDAEIRLVKADREWQTYIDDTEAMRNRISSDNLNTYYITGGDETMYLVGLRNGRYRLCERVKNPLRIDSLSCCFTPDGFRNERPDTIGGHIFQEFKMNEDGSALVNEDGTVRVIATWDSYMIENPEVMWMDPESLSPDLKALYDQLEPALQTIRSTYTLIRVGIGRSQATEGKVNVNGLVIEWKPSKRVQSKTGGLALKRSIPSMGQMIIVCAEDAATDDEIKDLESQAVVDAMRAFGAALAGTYQMTPDSYFVSNDALYESLEGEKFFRLQKGE